MTVAAAKTLELEQKLASFPKELSIWEEASKLNAPFEKHHSQISRLALQLTGLHETVVAELKSRVEEGTILKYARSI